MSEEEELEKQPKNRADYIRPYMWKKGQSGNPNGRPKGKTMKDYARQLLECMTDEEREDFLHGLPKEVIWEMAEGKPHATSDITSDGKPLPTPLLHVLHNDSNEKDTKPPKQN